METFIGRVLTHLTQNSVNLNDVVFILPSKRAGVFLKKELSLLIQKPIFAPAILSIEEFVENLSGLKLLENPELLFKLYSSYLKLTPNSEQESFDIFFTWGNTLLQDFNEIDRYLIDQDKIFDYLKAIKELNHWSLSSNQTPIIANHLKFWNRLKAIYHDYVSSLLEHNEGYQGLLYREACNNLELYMANNPKKLHIFLGFNALNTAERTIIQELLEGNQAQTFWDIDATFMDDPYHSASLFLKDYKKSWKFFKNEAFNWISDSYTAPKHIKIVGIPKIVGQAKYVGELLESIQKTNPSLKGVSVVLGEEALLTPLLNSIPNAVNSINITMGLPLKNIPMASLFLALFDLHHKNASAYYYKDVVNLMTLPTLHSLFQTDRTNQASALIDYINKNNITYLNTTLIKELMPDYTELVELVFGSWDNSPDMALIKCEKLIFKIKESLEPSTQKLELEQLYRFHNLFNKLSNLNQSFRYLDSISTLHGLFLELLNTETLDFKGEPLEGLQIMGMLESRVLDFETVIISSVNEGILPAGKSANSFIPYDVKLENGLPTYKEKDAVYTYHFYHLLQRAKQIYILYNTEVDALKGGEKSRFISQLEVEGIHPISHIIAQPKVPVLPEVNKSVKKTPQLIKEIQTLAQKGFSPSSLTSYIRNPIDFYYEKILGIKEFEDVEESIAHNTMGTIIHDTLEYFYKPYQNQFLTEDILLTFKNSIKAVVTKTFKNTYKQGNFSTGKNLLIFEVVQHFISSFIDIELDQLRKGNTIKILAIEASVSTDLKINTIETPIILQGKVDRVDEFNGVIRIIDYKSGRVEQNKLVINSWEDISTDYEKYSKPFQLLCYSYMMHKQNLVTVPVQAGIYSFKNLQSGLLKFIENVPGTKEKKDLITESTLLAFEIELHKLISEILDPDTDFIENDDIK